MKLCNLCGEVAGMDEAVCSFCGQDSWGYPPVVADVPDEKAG